MTRILFFVFVFFLSCKSGSHENNVKEDILVKKKDLQQKVITLNSLHDTDNVELKHSIYSFNLHYYENKPQYIFIKGILSKDSLLMNHYASENRGLYFTLSDSLCLNAFGVKYTNGHSGIDLVLNPQNEDLKYLSRWTEYENDGLRYDFSEMHSGKLKVYQYKEGDIIDSFYMVRQAK